MTTICIIILILFLFFKFKKINSKTKDNNKLSESIKNKQEDNNIPLYFDEVFNCSLNNERCYEVGETIHQACNEMANALFKEQDNTFYSLRKNISWLKVTGLSHHDYANSYWDIFYGYVIREPENPKDKNAIKVIDIAGKTVGYMPKNETKWVRNGYGEEFSALPYIGATYMYEDNLYAKICVIGNFENEQKSRYKLAENLLAESGAELIGNMLWCKNNL